MRIKSNHFNQQQCSSVNVTFWVWEMTDYQQMKRCCFVSLEADVTLSELKKVRVRFNVSTANVNWGLIGTRK